MTARRSTLATPLVLGAAIAATALLLCHDVTDGVRGIHGIVALAGFTLAALLHVLCVDAPERADPLRRAWRPRSLGLLLLVFVTVAHLGFADVIWGGHTMVSAPFYDTHGDGGRKTAGYGYTADPFAGNLIEGPGLWVTNRLIESGAPLWNPWEASGAPYLANGEMAAMSLLQLPLHVAPSIHHWDLYALFRMVLAAWFAAALAMGLGTSPRAAVLAGAVFGFGGGFLWHGNLVHLNSAVFVPLILLGAEAIVHRRSLGRAVFLAIVVGLSLNGGNPQPAVVASLLVALRLLAAVFGSGPAVALRAAALIGAASVAGAALTAATLLPLADVLRHSVTRDDFRGLDAAPLTTLWAWARKMHEGAYQPRWWSIGFVALSCGLAGFTLMLARRRHVGWLLGAAAMVSALYVPFAVEMLGNRIPVFNSIIWSKYVTGLQLLVGLGAAFAVGALARGTTTGRTVVATVLTAAALVELVSMAPDYPVRRDDPFEPRPGVVKFLDELEDDPDGMPWRTMAVGSVIPPLLTSHLGWNDVRSVSPVPLERYHRWLSPYCNPCAGPPYLLMGASRELVLSPCLDLTGVRWVVVGDHRKLVGTLNNIVLDTAPSHWGGMIRSMDTDTLEFEGLETIEAPRARWVLREGGFVSFECIPRSSRLRAAFSVRCLDGDGPFEATIRFGNDDVRRVTTSEPVEFEIKRYVTGFPVEFRAVSGGRLEFRITAWWIERYRYKQPTDFDLTRAHVDTASWTSAIPNKRALAPVRLVRNVRHMENEEAFWTLYDRFIATGEGWNWREELLLFAADGEELDDFTPAPEGTTEGDQVRFERPTPSSMRVSVRNASPAWLHLAMVDDGHWRCRVDGEEVPLAFANGPFMALPLKEAGDHVVELEYRPWPFRLGVLISGVTALLLVCALRVAWRAKNPR